MTPYARLLALASLCLITCGTAGPEGPAGPAGPMGAPGSTGPAGSSDGGATVIQGARIVQRTVKGVDGSRVLYGGLWDKDRMEACEYATAADGQLRCMPIHNLQTFNSGSYFDAACKQPVFTITAGRCPTAYGYTVEYTKTCGGADKYSFYTLASTPAPAMLWTLDGMGRCLSTTSDPGTLYFSGAPIDVGAFVPGSVDQ